MNEIQSTRLSDSSIVSKGSCDGSLYTKDSHALAKFETSNSIMHAAKDFIKQQLRPLGALIF
ncbi:hypothetical protein C1O24_00360 [Vibrio diazotrophicus]|nr:hypothetical protein C1O24_00360 [Vibrio diazotrophicus]